MFILLVACPVLTLQKGRIHYSNGNEVGSTGRYTVGTRAQFSCYQGYNQIGVSEATCQDSGRWDQQTPRCTTYGNIISCYMGVG